MPTQSRLLDLPAEIFPVVAGHFPLYATPRSLLSLALTSRISSSIVLPILYSHLILQNEKDALAVLNDILENPDKGSLVRGIHIRSKLSAEVRKSGKVDVVRALEKVVTSGALPLIHTLELHLEDWSWFLDEERQGFNGYGELREPFWQALKEKCPRLHTLTVTNIGDPLDDLWLNKSGIFEVEGIRNLTYRFSQSNLDKEGNQLLLKCVTSLAPRLRTINLAPNSDTDEWMELTPFFALDFPFLESLTLYAHVLNDTSTATSFWERHPTLEYINVNYGDETPRFGEDVASLEGFLPKLKHLIAPFKDVRNLAPILPQLLSLAILNTINAQAPYILRYVLPNGLPNLQSLNIVQTSDPMGNIKNVEAAYWYESAEGEFIEAPKNKKLKKKIVDDGWMRSIVIGAPNLKELALQAFDLKVSNYDKIIPELSNLHSLKRFFYKGDHYSISFDDSEEPEAAREQFISQARLLASAVPTIEEVGDISAMPPQRYVTAKIVRDSSKNVVDVEVVLGDGLVIGQADQAFPRAHEGSLV